MKLCAKLLIFIGYRQIKPREKTHNFFLDFAIQDIYFGFLRIIELPSN